MMRPSLRLLLALVVLLGTAAPATATSVRPLDLVCPVCGTATKGVTVMSTNSFGGVDRDFCRHAIGSQPLLLVATTCPKCHYSAFADGFAAKPPAAVIEAVKKGALVVAPHASPKARGDEEGVAPSSNLPAWVRHDLILQVLRLGKASTFKLAWQALVTSWAVRLEARMDVGGAAEDEKTFEALVARSGIKGDDRSGDSVKLGAWLIRNLPTLPEKEAVVAAPVAIRLLRERGENGLLLASLGALQKGFAPDRWASIEKTLRESAQLEQKYQREAVALFEKYLASPECAKDDDRFHVTYLAGELHRRLGERDKALELYVKAEKMTQGSAEIRKWLAEQKATVATP